MQQHECELIEAIVEVAAATALAFACKRFADGRSGEAKLSDMLRELRRYVEKCEYPLSEGTEDDDQAPEGARGLGPDLGSGGAERPSEEPPPANPVAKRSTEVSTSVARRLVLTARRYGSRSRSRRKGRRR